VKPVTIESLVAESARSRVGRVEGFRFCPDPSCDVAYFNPGTGQRFRRADVKVRIGQKETPPPRTVCYCFNHTVEEIEADVERTGTSLVPDEITEKCRRGLDRCEETNPQGACCLGNLRRVLKEAQAKAEQETRPALVRVSHEIEEDCCAMNSQDASTQLGSRLRIGTVAQVGALASAIVASACCWLPLLLVGLGVSGGALAATFEAWRPVLLPVTFALLGLAFYFTYRKPRVATLKAASSAAGADGCCAAPGSTSNAEDCCPPEDAKLSALRRVNRVMLWVVTAFVLAFAFFPNYVGYVLGDSGTLSAPKDLDKVVVAIEGMTCEACAVRIEDQLRHVPGVVAAEVSYARGEAVVGIAEGSAPPRKEILKAISEAGDYRGRFTDQVRWGFAVEGMTCGGCEAGVTDALAGLPGVSHAEASYRDKRAVVEVAPDAGVKPETLISAIEKLGYRAALEPAPDKGEDP